jgi:hypothetical protein
MFLMVLLLSSMGQQTLWLKLYDFFLFTDEKAN